MKKYIAYYGIAITLFFTSIASAMDHPFAMPSLLNPTIHNLDIRNICAAAQKHNKNIPLIATDKDILGLIWNQFINKNNSLPETIKNILALSATCSYFNNKLEEFGKMLQRYDNESKNALLTKCLVRCSGAAYWKTRRSFLLFVYAGAEHNTCRPMLPLLLTAAQQNDIDMVTTLFRYGADANLKAHNEPILWNAKIKDIAQLFIDNGVDLNIYGSRLSPNILWGCVWDDKPNTTLTQFYLDKGVDPRKLNSRGDSLLHMMHSCLISDDNPEQIKVIKLLLTKINDIINATNNDGKTPLDLLIKSFFPKPNIIALFKEHGAKTSQELKQAELQ